MTGTKTVFVGTIALMTGTKTVFVGTNGAMVGTKTVLVGTIGVMVGTKTPDRGTIGTATPGREGPLMPEEGETLSSGTSNPKARPPALILVVSRG